jgi:hypothetical protein
MINRFWKGCALIVGAAAMLGSSVLQAAHRSEAVEIPFAFKVHRTHLPAGTYRLEHRDSEVFATLVNLKTGEHIELLRPVGRDTGKAKLVFERGAGGYVLKRLS